MKAQVFVFVYFLFAIWSIENGLGLPTSGGENAKILECAYVCCESTYCI